MEEGSDEVLFECADGTKFKMFHSQDCCESVSVEDVCGDVSDLIDSEILDAREETSDKPPEGMVREYEPDSETWTFYIIRTMKGTVTIRWFGTSNGYYSESVDFEEVK